MIKPSDITDEQIEAAEQSIESKLDAWNCASREIVAAILNAAIEAGLVSPRLPATDDPRVLRRACELLAEWYANVADRDEKKELDDAIQTAIEMLETEA
jgi:hypothetical protein